MRPYEEIIEHIKKLDARAEERQDKLLNHTTDAANRLLRQLRADATLHREKPEGPHADRPLQLLARAQSAEKKVRDQHEKLQALGQQYEEAKEHANDLQKALTAWAEQAQESQEQQQIETDRANTATQSHVAERDRRRALEEQYERLKATIEREREGKEELLAKLKGAQQMLTDQRADLQRYRGITDRPQPSTGMRYETIRPLDPEDAGWIVIDMRPATGYPVAIATNLIMQEALDLTKHLNS